MTYKAKAEIRKKHSTQSEYDVEICNVKSDGT